MEGQREQELDGEPVKDNVVKWGEDAGLVKEKREEHMGWNRRGQYWVQLTSHPNPRRHCREGVCIT